MEWFEGLGKLKKNEKNGMVEKKYFKNEYFLT